MIPQLKSIFNQNQLTQLINLFNQRVNVLIAGLALKQNKFDYSGSAISTSSVTINDKKGGVARFTRVIPPLDFRVFTINSNLISSTSKIIPVLVYSGAGFPVILSQSVTATRVDFIVANLDVDGSGGLDTDATLSIQYQIVE